MSPEDVRHGTHRGYVVGCRLLCCTAAQTRYMKLYRLGRIPRMVDATGTVRRIRALQALGWTYGDMGARYGYGENWANMLTRRPLVVSTNAERITQIYDDLCMVIPVGPYATRTRNLARRKGWPPPLAWDDIDNDAEPIGWEYIPRATRNQNADDALDPVVVMRLLEGDRVTSTAAERTAALERWVADGGTQAELCRWHGWQEGRYSAGLRLVKGGAA